MRKYLLNLAAITCLFLATVNFANAKEGHYVGFNISHNDIEHDYKPSPDPDYDSADKKIGLGLSYGYKYSLNDRIFIQPEVSFDYVDSIARDNSSYK